ncbi:thioredoxin-disulfide reductase [Irregularibacter muris]|uniref:Thioredoxin reductase n=1 Tax=Irregularibacter muris TaxID=1796619 RepID=A0AAE3HCJ2_9FIRM|nr:thioredoxin-disulfide reductase [Irregularibacter muris]MCR1897610.1 thioredoxin-disulfide reductase [Irregularibacter muris]
MSYNHYDTVIIGAGAGGLSAGLYAARSRMKTLILERGQMGGQTATTEDVENYPGSIENPTGPKLMERMKKQSEEFGCEIKQENVENIEKKENIFVVKTNKNTYEAKTMIIATGAEPKLLGVPGEIEYRGRGVSYCATCDGDFFQELNIAVVGGGDSAVEEGMYLTKFANKVTLIHRRDELRAVKSLQERAFANEKMEFIWDTVVEEIKGNGVVQSLVLKNKKTNELSELKVDGVFIYVGYQPISQLFQGLVEMDEIGYILGDEEMRTNVPGLFVAGDVRKKMLKQIITAAADGAIAAVSAERYIAENF